MCSRCSAFHIVSLVHQDEEEEAGSEEDSSEAGSSDTSSSSSDEELVDRAMPVRQPDQHVDVGLEVASLVMINSKQVFPNILVRRILVLFKHSNISVEEL